MTVCKEIGSEAIRTSRDALHAIAFLPMFSLCMFDYFIEDIGAVSSSTYVCVSLFRTLFIASLIRETLGKKLSNENDETLQCLKIT